ncbi:hypothetical protein [Kutzneria kofuensis]|uniref:RNA polymerase subunit RPABC4/transcription elongation factor Spt4 n=1 Tax=Kutzneria kofuensis TaxID=103725 RepID=A0A7W9NER5_9PSEU|nr:hypothetical protein [Kutzneria kofuensis]MBB5890602.1 RNA polymerase subunit RPABC4/transcription elongation factor Spt4 [Kutzneria kofuensis]
MTPRWSPFTPEQLDQLVANRVPLTSQEQRRCPACGHQAVRRYYYEQYSSGRGHLIGMSYSWCAHCHRYTSSTGIPLSSDYDFDEPVDVNGELARLRRTDLLGLLDHLDRLWESGDLPQKFTPKTP